MNIFGRTNSDIKKFYEDKICKKTYLISVIITSIISYGFSIFNRTVSIDDLHSDYYVGSGQAMIRATRWGFTLYGKLLGLVEYTPFVYDFLAVLSLIVGAFVISSVFYKFSKIENIWTYTIFSCLYVSSPLINEIFEYTGANFAVYFGIALSAYIILLLSNTNKHYFPMCILYGFMYSPVISSYESAAFTYITIVFACMYLKYRQVEKNNWSWFFDGIKYSLPLIFAMFFRYSIGFALIKMCGLTFQANGDTCIYWLDREFLPNLIWLIKETILKYGIEWNYMPIFEFAVSVFLFIFIVINDGKKNKSLYLLGLLAVSSVFFQSMLQGQCLPYRQSQPVQFFIAFTCFLIINISGRHRKLYKVVLVIMLFMCLRQSIYLHKILALNNQRSDNEAYIIQTIGSKIYSEFDKDKEVIFVGKYLISDNINNQLMSGNSLFSKISYSIKNIINKDSEIEINNYKYIETNVKSLINWALEKSSVSEKFFSYYGFDINIDNEHSFQEKYVNIAKENDMKPYEIIDMGDYLLVCIGTLDE